MSRYLTKFANSAQYIDASTSLEFPNVSLIEESAEIKYSIFKNKELEDAEFGDILIANKSTNNKIVVNPNNYNTTDYSTTDYEPIAICIWDKESHSHGETVFMSLKFMSYTYPTEGKYPSDGMRIWNNTSYKSLGYIVSSSDAQFSYHDDKEINEYVRDYLISQDWEWLTLSTFPYGGVNGLVTSEAFATCWRFSTPGTSAGDWYLPCPYTLTKFWNNISTIENIIDTVNQTYTGSSTSQKNKPLWTSITVYNTDHSNIAILDFNNRVMSGRLMNSTANVRAVLIVRQEQL